VWLGHEEEKDRKIFCRLKVICYLIDVRIDSNKKHNNRSKKKKKTENILQVKSYLLSYRCKDRQQQQQQPTKTPLP